MTTSASTPRLRLTLAWYVLLLALVATTSRPCAAGLLGALGDFAGLLLMTVAVLGRLWSSVFIAGYKDEHLVTVGPYAYSRNPLYAFSIIGGLGVGLASGSLLLAAATLVVLWSLYWRAILAEEKFLQKRHGEVFTRYCAQVPRLWPSFRSSSTPASVNVNVAVYRKAFVDAASFVFIFALIQLLDAVRAAGLLPTLFNLW